jgi:GNAT superfamily N-acetyltransferase
MRLPNSLRRFIACCVTHSAQHVIVGRVQPGNPADEGPVDDRGTECSAVESLAQLDAVAADFAAFPLDKPRSWLAEGGFIVVARRSSGARRIIGYRLCQRGIFRSDLGHRGQISPDFLLIHWAVVLPEYRGQRVAEALQIGSHRIARRRGIAWTCGAVSLANSASLAAHLRPRSSTSPRVVATIHRLSFFGDRFSVTTPWSRVARALEDLRLREQDRPDEGKDSIRA